MTDNVITTILDNLINPDYYTSVFLNLLMGKTESFSWEQLIEDLRKASLNLQEHPSTDNWKRLIQIVSVMTAVGYSHNKDVINVLTEIWTFTADANTKCKGEQLDVSDLVVTLLDATRFRNLRDDNFSAMLMSLATLCVHILIHPQCRIQNCYFLRRNIEDLSHRGIQSVASALTELFGHLLKDEDPRVRREVLEVFEYVVYKCLELLVAEISKTLVQRPSIRYVKSSFLN